MNRHLTRRAPHAGRKAFSWGRVPASDSLGNVTGVHYRLFRRDHRGVVHMVTESFYRECDRATIARCLRRLRHALRDQVDEIDLRAWGVAA